MMDSALFIVVLVFINPQFSFAQPKPSQGQKPGFKVLITEKGVNFLGNYSKALISTYFENSGVHSLKGNLMDDIDIELNDLTFTNFNHRGFESTFQVEPGYGLVWQINNVSLDATANYKTNFQSSEGQLKLTVFRLNAFLLMSARQSGQGENGGNLKPELDDCQVYIAAVRVNFDRKAISGRLLGAFHRRIDRMAKNGLQQYLCHVLANELAPPLQDHFLKVKTGAHLFDALYYSYGLVAPPTFTDNNQIITDHDGSVYAKLYDGQKLLADKKLPFESGDIPSAPSSPSKMIHLYMNNHTLASLFYWMDQFRKFDYDFKRETIENEEFKEYLLTECSGICAGVLFPTLEELYPASSVEISVTTITPPKIRIHDGRLNITIKSKVDGYIAQLENPLNRTEFLSANLILYSEMTNIRFDTYYNLKGDLKLSGYSISNFQSNIEEITADSTDFLVTSLMDLFVKKDYASKITKGIKLPPILDFKLYETSVELTEGLIEVSSNVCTEAIIGNCELLSKTETSTDTAKVEKTTPQDYYDYEYSYSN